MITTDRALTLLSLYFSPPAPCNAECKKKRAEAIEALGMAITALKEKEPKEQE